MPLPTYRFEGWTLDMGRRVLRDPDWNYVNLTSGELDMLAFFCANPNQDLSVEKLYHYGRAKAFWTSEISVRVFIKRLRSKLLLDPNQPPLIVTVRNRGYFFGARVEVLEA